MSRCVFLASLVRTNRLILLSHTILRLESYARWQALQLLIVVACCLSVCLSQRSKVGRKIIRTKSFVSVSGDDLARLDDNVLSQSSLRIGPTTCYRSDKSTPLYSGSVDSVPACRGGPFFGSKRLRDLLWVFLAALVSF